MYFMLFLYIIKFYMYFYIFKLRMQQHKEINIKQINIYIRNLKKFFIYFF